MKNVLQYCLIICLIVYIFSAFPQTSFDKHNPIHLQGLEALKTGKIEGAENLFKLSVEEFSYAPSYYELAKISKEKNTIRSRERARKFVRKAI